MHLANNTSENRLDIIITKNCSERITKAIVSLA
jgi:hypothetical protein